MDEAERKKNQKKESQKLRHLREENGHSLEQMLSLISMSRSLFHRKVRTGNLSEVIAEYEQALLSEHPAKQQKIPLSQRLHESSVKAQLSRDCLPPIGSRLERDGMVALVIRHTGQDSIAVDLQQKDGITRRAEWTIRQHPRLTDVGEWKIK